MSDERWFERMTAVAGDAAAERAPARLKSKIYSRLVVRMAESGPLMDLGASKDAGGRLCIFEETVTILPRGSGVQSMNPCRICHARVLGERLDHAPIFWPGCPYAEFHKN
jgi:hypothetical protein